MPLGIPPANINSLEYTGLPIGVVPVVEAQRAPTVNDKNYPTFCLWRDTTNNNAWILVGFRPQGSSPTAGDALWRLFQFGAAVGTVDSLTGNSGGAVGPDVSNNINVVGDGTTITITGVPGTNTLTASLIGGSAAVEKFTVQSATAPGLTTVSPIAGVVTVNGSSVAAHSVPIETRSRALGAYNVEVQYAAAVATTDATKSGLAHFSSVDFSVDASGFVALTGTGTAAIQKIQGDDGNQVGPAAGLLFDRGATTTYVTGNIGTSTIKSEVVSTLNTFLLGQGATTPSIPIGPLTNGQVIIGSTGLAPVAAVITGSLGITVSNGAGTINISGTGGGFTWTDVTGVSQAMALENGYAADNVGLVTLTLPVPGGTQFGNTVKVMGFGAGGWKVAQGAGQSIVVGSHQSTPGVGGSIASTNRYDAIELVCGPDQLTWCANPGFTGNLTVV